VKSCVPAELILVICGRSVTMTSFVSAGGGRSIVSSIVLGPGDVGGGSSSFGLESSLSFGLERKLPAALSMLLSGPSLTLSLLLLISIGSFMSSALHTSESILLVFLAFRARLLEALLLARECPDVGEVTFDGGGPSYLEWPELHDARAGPGAWLRGEVRASVVVDDSMIVCMLGVWAGSPVFVVATRRVEAANRGSVSSYAGLPGEKVPLAGELQCGAPSLSIEL